MLRDQSGRKDGLAPAHIAVADWLLDQELVCLQPAWMHWIFDDVLLQAEMLPQPKKGHWIFSAWYKCQEMWFLKSPSVSKFTSIRVSSVAEAGQMIPYTEMALNWWLFGFAIAIIFGDLICLLLCHSSASLPKSSVGEASWAQHRHNQEYKGISFSQDKSLSGLFKLKCQSSSWTFLPKKTWIKWCHYFRKSLWSNTLHPKGCTLFSSAHAGRSG